MRLQLVLILTLCQIYALGQKTTINGHVFDKTTGEKLTGAFVYTNNKVGTSTNNYGFYSISTPSSDTVKITFSFVGYKQITIKLSHPIASPINIGLTPNTELDEVIVKAEANIEDRLEVSTHNIPIKTLKRLPSIGGETDILKALQTLPGVKSGDEGHSGLYIRGGSPDQNLMIVDDVPLYYVNHLGGFTSIFNADAVKNVELIKGGFPARYGNRLSSVLNVGLKDGNKKNMEKSYTVGILSSKITIQGPLKKDTSSFLISFRRTMFDLITRPVSYLALDGVTFGYNFYDLNAKIDYSLSSKDHLYLSIYGGDDNLNFYLAKKTSSLKKASLSMRWGNIMGSARWNHVFHQKLFSNTTLYYTRYRSIYSQKQKTSENTFSYSYYSGVADLGVIANFEYMPGNQYSLFFGGSGVYQHFTPTRTKVSGNNSEFNDGYNPWASNYSIYAENRINLGIIKFNIGARYNWYSLYDKKTTIEPRLLASIKVQPKAAVKIAYAQTRQTVHLLTGNGMGIPNEYWLPATPTLNPEEASQYSVAYTWTSKKDLELSIEAFYKQMTNLIAFTEGLNYLGNSGEWTQMIEKNGKGECYGLELFAQKKYGRNTGWIGYTLAWSERQFENINHNKVFPFKYDQRHELSFVYNYEISKNASFSASWTYHTGNAITMANGHYYAIDENDDRNSSREDFMLKEVYQFGSYNGYRMRDYHRLDIGFIFSKTKPKGERIWNIGVINVYNRKNPYFYQWDIEGNSGEKPKLYQVSLFPIMPSVSYSYYF